MADALPPALGEEIESALAALEGRDDGHLPLPLRRAVRSHFGDMGDGGAGRRRLFDLHRRCVERVLPRWREALPDDRRPERMAELAEGVLAGRIEREATRLEQGHFVNDIDVIAELDVRGHAVSLAAASLLSTAAAGDYGDETPIDADDDDIDPAEWSSDPSGLARGILGTPLPPVRSRGEANVLALVSQGGGARRLPVGRGRLSRWSPAAGERARPAGGRYRRRDKPSARAAGRLPVCH